MTWNPNDPLATPLDADGNNSGAVNAADYSIYRNLENTIGAWYDPPAGLASTSALIDSTTAPQVVNVTISGSSSVHAAYAFDAHDGSGEQLRTVPVGGADTISITFNEQVNVQSADLRVVGMATATVPTLAEFNYNPATKTAAWRYTGLLAKDYYILSLSDTVTDAEGYRLDGEWVNPLNLTTTNAAVSEFPSGNGAAGGDFNFLFTLLAGDANLDATVGIADLSILAANYGILTGRLFTQGDFNGDGAVSGADLSMLAGVYPTTINFGFVRADLNFDRAINDFDLTTLVDNFGLTGAMYEDGDLNGDGSVTQADLDLMFAQYGLEFSVVG